MEEKNIKINSTEITITLPIYPILKYDPISQDELKSVLDDFCSGFNTLQTEFKYHVINKIETSTDIKDSILKDYEVNIYIQLKDKIKEQVKELKVNKNTKKSTYIPLMNAFYIYETVKEIQDEIFYLSVLSNIAYPGLINTDEIIVSTKGYTSFKMNPIYSPHRHLLKSIKKDGWIEFKRLKIKQVIDWFTKFNFSFNDGSLSKTHTALNAFTYLFDNKASNDTINLIYSMIGIEALYCRGKDGITTQINEKVQIVLGPRNEMKNALKKMYNLRSQLLHGSGSIPAIHNIKRGSSFFDKELFNSIMLSIAILTASLQELIIRDKESFEFRLELI